MPPGTPDMARSSWRPARRSRARAARRAPAQSADRVCSLAGSPHVCAQPIVPPRQILLMHSSVAHSEGSGLLRNTVLRLFDDQNLVDRDLLEDLLRPARPPHLET